MPDPSPQSGEGGRAKRGRVGFLPDRDADPTRLCASLRSRGATLPFQGRDGARGTAMRFGTAAPVARVEQGETFRTLRR